MKMKGGGKRGLMGDDHDHDHDYDDDEKKKSSKKYEKSYFDVLGICCSSEVPLIEKLLKPLEGVHHVSVIVPSRTVIVLHDSLLISQLQIVKALNQARLEANVRVKGESKYRKKWPSPFAVACGVLLLLSFLKYAYPPFRWLAVAAVVVGIPPIILKGIAAIRNFRLDINILMLIAVAGSIVLNDYWEAGTIVFLFTIAEWLESRASHKATAVMLSLMNIAPQRAVLAATGVEVDAGEVMVNTILAVKAGDIIPIDGIVVDGKCEVDEKTLTGESFPVVKQLESSVWAGTINLNGYISVKTTALAEDCVVARMAKLVEEAQNNKSKTQRFIDKCAIYYTPAVVIVSGCLAIIPAALRLHNRNEWYHLALVVLVSACPCALILSTPIATFCALSKAATLGLLIKGAEYLETLAKIRVVAFDKTGTITRGEFLVSDFHSFVESVSLGELLYWVSSIESKSSHPMAAAIVDYAHTHSIEPKPDKVEEFQNFPGEGIYGKIDGKDIFVGNRKIAIRAGCLAVPTLEGETNEGKSTGYIFLGSSAAGIFSLTDVCRTGVAEALKELKTLGIKTAMLTGDCPAAARHAQDQLEGALEAVHAELLPQDKARIIKEFQNESPTAMVGDGINDAPALATADIGISMGVSGSALATETGHIVLMSNDIRKIPKAVRLARKTRRKIIENVMLSITTKAGIIGLAIAGHPLVWAAVLADVGTCLLVIFNSMLLLRGTPAYGRKHCSSPHAHKHGCKPNHSHSHSHSHKHCSSVSKVKSQCKPQTCSSKMCAPSSCESKKSCSDSKIKGSCCESDPFTSVSHGNYKHGCCESDVPVSASPGHNKCSDSKSIHGCCESNKKCSDSKKKDSCCESVPFTSVSHGNNKRGCCESDLPVSVSPGHNKCLDSKNIHGCCGSHTTISASHGDKMCSDSENTHSCCDPGPLVAASCGKKCLDSEIKHAHCESPLVSAAVGGQKCLDSENKHGCCVNADQVKEAKDHGSSSDMITLDFGELTVSSTHGCATHSNQSSCSEKKHGCCAHADHVIEAKHSHHGSNCDITTLDFIEHAISSTHGCAVHPKQSSCSEKNHVHDKSDQETLSCHGFDEAKHCDHGSESTVDHGTGSCNVHNHSLATLELCHDVAKSNKHCHHAKEYITEEELNNMVRTCCKYYSSNQDVHSECMNHGSGHGSRTHGCMSLEKRHVDGCCKSFRKECCGKNPHFGLGGLSEIVIE